MRILQKQGRNNVLVKSFGASRDPKEIARMVQQAREYIMRRTGTYYNLFNPPPAPTIDDFVGELRTVRFLLMDQRPCLENYLITLDMESLAGCFVRWF